MSLKSARPLVRRSLARVKLPVEAGVPDLPMKKGASDIAVAGSPYPVPWCIHEG